jgi:pimeloyl-ACP methyl ester carboxylesterase
MIPPPGEIMILHGRSDERVPIEDSRYYAEKYPEQVQLIEVDSDHRLADQHSQIWDLVREYLLS